jgi:hypothetical protein
MREGAYLRHFYKICQTGLLVAFMLKLFLESSEDAFRMFRQMRVSAGRSSRDTSPPTDGEAVLERRKTQSFDWPGTGVG